MKVPSAAGVLKVRSDKRKVCLFLYLLWTLVSLPPLDACSNHTPFLFFFFFFFFFGYGKPSTY
jgi:hypothetical protein